MTEWRRRNPKRSTTEMGQENQRSCSRALQRQASFIANRGWKSSNSSPLSVGGELFPLTSPFIEPSQRSAATDSLRRTDSGRPVTGSDSTSPSVSHEAPVVGLQRTGPGDPHQCGILLCERPAAALEEACLHSRSK